MTANNEYGNALFLLSEEVSASESVLEDVKTAREALSQNPEYVKLLDTPAIPKSEKLSLIDSAFAALDINLINLLKILCERHSVHSFFEVARTYIALYNEARDIEEVEAVTAVKMTEEQLSKMKIKLEEMTGKHIIIKNTVSPDILGGVKLRYMGIQLDGSVKTRLDKFSDSLKNTVI